MRSVSSVDRDIGDPWTNCTNTIRFVRWKRLMCVYRTSYFMRIANVSTIPGRFEVFAIASIRACLRRDRRAQGRVTATSVGGEISKAYSGQRRLASVVRGYFGAIAKFLRGRVEPHNDTIKTRSCRVVKIANSSWLVVFEIFFSIYGYFMRESFQNQRVFNANIFTSVEWNGRNTNMIDSAISLNVYWNISLQAISFRAFTIRKIFLVKWQALQLPATAPS